MDIYNRLVENAMKLNLEIINFQKELYEIANSELSKEDLIEVTNNINYIIGTLFVQYSAIGNILANTKINPQYLEENKTVIRDFLNKLEEYCEEYQVGIRD